MMVRIRIVFPSRPHDGRPPGSDARLRRRLVAGAFADNVRTLRNRPPGRRLRSRRSPWRLAAAGVAITASSALLSAPRPGAGPVIETVTASTAPAAPSLTEPMALPPTTLSSRIFPLGVRRVVVDPGHGGRDMGTRTPTGLSEKEITLDVAVRLTALLSEAGYDATLTRTTDARLELKQRADLANERKADLFVSIHVNWLEDGRENRGIETYYLGPSDDPFVIQLASAENVESGYSMADVRPLVENIYADLRQTQSRTLARSIQRALVRSARQFAPTVRDRGVRSAPFLVLVDTQMPAVLAEVSSLSNRDEARLLAESSYRDRIARALFEGITAYSQAVLDRD